MPLAQARIETRLVRVQLDQQQNPISVWRASLDEQRQRGSFKELCEGWYRNEIQGRNLKHPGVPRCHLDNYLLPKLGRIAAADVTAADIARMLDGLKSRAPRQPMVCCDSRVVPLPLECDGASCPAIRRRIFRCASMLAALRRRAAARSAQIYWACSSMPYASRPPLGATTCSPSNWCSRSVCARGELLGARWTEFDLDGETDLGVVWYLPTVRTKTGEGLDIPLAATVVEWFSALRTLAAGSEYIFPKRRCDPRERVPHMGIDTLNVAMQRGSHGLEHFTLHDLRRTARTHLAALGVRREVAERCLGHKLRGVEGTYDRHDYFKERRLALGQWTHLLLNAERGKNNVTAIGQKSSQRSAG